MRIEQCEPSSDRLYTTQYTYDPADRLATVTYPTNEVVTQTYSARNLPYSVSGSVAGTLVSSAVYNLLGQVSQIDLGNGLRTIFNYFGIDTVDGGDSSSYYGKLYRIRTYDPMWSTDRQHEKYWWDASGNLTARKDVQASETETFSYDGFDRLTGVSGPYSESYAYDEIGNMTSKNSVSYTYGSSAGPHAVTGVGVYTQTYDDNGNMTGRANSTGTQTLDWNVENQLDQVIGTAGGYSGTTTTYTYDGDGKRIKKVEGNTTTVYVNMFYEHSVVNNTNINTSYYYLGGKLVATKKGSTLEFLHQDSLSSTALSTNSSGTQVSATKYLPFGSTRSSSGTLSTSRMFTSQHMDSGSDLYFYNARYYDASLGRFISPDTIVGDPTDPQQFNRYSYVLNNPLTFLDPSGHDVTFVQYWNPDGSRDTSLDDAWALYESLDRDTANAMMNSDQHYIFAWSDLGSFTTDDRDTHVMRISTGYKGNLVDTTTTIAHESFHGREGHQADSVEEEVRAYQYEYNIAVKLNDLGVMSDDDIVHSFSRKFKDFETNPSNSQRLTSLNTDMNDAQDILKGGAAKNRKDMSQTERFYGSLPLRTSSATWWGTALAMIGSFLK